MANSRIKDWVQQDFEGGWSTAPKVGIKNSALFIQSFDFRKDPGQMTTLPGPSKESGNAVQDLVVNEIMTNDGTIYALGNTGYLYKRTTGGVWTEIGKLTDSGYGMSYRPDFDALYITGTKTVSLYNPVSGTPLLTPDKYGISQSTFSPTTQTPTVNPNQSGSSATYSVPLVTNETSANRRLFQSDIEPLNKLSVFIVNKGTGNWTLTMHDGLNNVLGTKTVSNASLTSNAFNDFAFTAAPNAQVRIYVAPNARTYHFHLTSTVADGTVSCSTANDLSTADMQLWADRLVVTKNGLHPMQRFLQYETIGNGNYLSVWEPLSDPPTNSEWLRHKLVFPQEYEVTSTALTNEFIIIAAEKNTSVSTSTPQEGMLFFWDGTSATYNYNVPIPEGSPYALHTYKNVAYYYAGGSWWAITSPVTQPVKLRSMPGADTEFSGATAPIVIYPYAATVRRGIHLMAYPSTTTNTSINFGVYSWGAVDKNFPESFGYSYVLSTLSQNYSVSNNLQIGMVKSLGDTLHISWRDDQNGGYGVDVVNNASVPAPTATWQSLILDDGIVGRLKTGDFMEVAYELPAGSSLTMGYNIGRAGWVTSPAYSTTSLWLGRHKRARFAITANADGANGGRWHEIQLRVDVTTGTATTPAMVRMMRLKYDSNSDEQTN